MADIEIPESLAAVAPIEHDFRQPLQALALLQAALASRISDPQDREIVTDMGRAIDSMSEMVDALMLAAKIDAGKIAPVLGPVSLSSVLNGAAAAYRELAARKGIEIRVVPVAACMHSDANLLGRLIRTLVSNAVAFSDGGHILLGVRRRGALLRIEVWDRGPGIPPEAQTRMFERFYSDDPAFQGRSPHIGLGLAVARDLAALLGHDLTVRSWPGRGSVFTLTGSAEPESGSGADDGAAEHTRRGGVADQVIAFAGDPASLDPVIALFEGWQARPVRVSGPDSLMEILSRGALAPRLIVLGAGGGTDLRGLWTVIERSGSDVPVVLIAAEPAPADGFAIAEAQILRPPVNPGRLRALAEHLVAG